jgi:hypothetical protein
MANDKKNRKQRPKCPPIPAGWTWKFTGPAYTSDMSLREAQQAWDRFRDSVSRLSPMPSQKRQ